MNKPVSDLSISAQRKANERAERDFLEGFDGGQSKREEGERRRARHEGTLSWVTACAAVIGAVTAFLTIMRQ